MHSNQTIGRRSVVAALTALMVAPIVRAQSAYPSRPIKLVVGYGAASGADVVARVIAQRLSEAFKQNVIVENKAGAGGLIAAQEFVRAPNDGYTLMLGAMPTLIISPATNSKIAFDPLRDFAPVSQVVSVDLVLITNPQKTPATNLKEFIAYSQKQPVNFFGTPGPGTVGHFLSAMFEDTAKAKVEPVHFKATGDSVTALLSGDIHALFVSYPVAVALAKAGKVRALAVTGATRSPQYPDTPTVREVGYPKLEASSWYGVFAPANTPQEILKRLSAEFVKAANLPEVMASYDEQGLRVTALNQEQFAAAMKRDMAKWGAVVKATGFTTQN